MKSEQEIKEKLSYYESILAGMESGKMIDSPEIFLRVSRHFPKEATEMLNNLNFTEVLIGNLPAEDQSWVRQWFSTLGGFAREVLSSRIGILRWTLEGEKESGGGDR